MQSPPSIQGKIWIQATLQTAALICLNFNTRQALCMQTPLEMGKQKILSLIIILSYTLVLYLHLLARYQYNM